MSRPEKSSNNKDKNDSENLKRKFEEVEHENSASSDDEDDDNLFLPQAREVLGQSKKVAKEQGHTSTTIDPNELDDDQDNDEDYEDVEEEETTVDENLVGESSESGEEEEEEEEPKESIEELLIGREAQEEDEIVTAITKATQPQEKTKPPDLRLSSMVADFSFHPNADIIAASDMDGEITIFKYGIEENALLHTLNHHKKPTRFLMYNPDGSTLFSTAKDKKVCLIDTETMQIKQTIQKAHKEPIYSMVCMNENIWASGDDDGVVKVWDVRRNVQLPVCEFTKIDEFVSSMITDSSSRLLLCTSGEGTLTAYNTRARKMDSQSEVYPSEMNCLAMIRQDTKVLTGLGNGNMYIFDWNAFGYHSDSFGDNPAGVNCMLPITDNIVIIGCEDGKIRAINVFPHRYIGVVGQHKFGVERIDISTCGQYIATSSHDGRVRFWNISYFENPDIVAQTPTKKSVRNKKKSLRKERLGFQLPSSKKRNKSDFFAGLADPEPEEEADEENGDDDSDSGSD